MFSDPHNTFRPNDAFAFVDAYRWGCVANADAIRERLASLSARMDRVSLTGADIPTYMLAAYRGYEAALSFVEYQIGWTHTLCESLVSYEGQNRKPRKARICRKCRERLKTARKVDA